jgi:choloylglycine hydrolase
MQYLLDTCESVGQVIESASTLVIDGWSWHFFAADKSGKTASLEFLDGKPVVHIGESMPVQALCNTVYDQEMERLDAERKKADENPGFLEGKEIPRFVQAAVMLERFPDSSKPPVEYAFDILKALERGGTQWSFVCDLKNQRAWFKTANSAKIKQVDMKAFNPGCAEPAKFLDIHADLAGDVSGNFRDYSFEANRKFAGQALEAILKISPQFDKMVALQGGTMEGLLDRFAGYPEKLNCQK